LIQTQAAYLDKTVSYITEKQGFCLSPNIFKQQSSQNIALPPKIDIKKYYYYYIIMNSKNAF